MKTLVYRITLLEPGLFTALEGDPNSGVSFPFIPGSVLRGALIHKYRGANKINPADDAARRLFFNGATRFLNGYPVADNAPSAPTPRAWQHVKRDEANVSDATIETLDDKKQWAELSAPFAIRQDANAKTIQPERQLTIHIQRPRAAGRPQRNNGAIFRYEALAPNQTFEAVIQCEDADETTLKNLLKGEIALGGSRAGAYGRAAIKIANEKDEAATEKSSAGEAKTNDGKLRVVLQSDALLRDVWGQFTSDPQVVGQAIAARLGIADGLKALDAFAKTRYVGGFNRTWGLPLPQMMAIEMGSVFEFEMPSPEPDPTVLETLGIGERRAEGFGRVAVYDPMNKTFGVEKWEYAVAGEAGHLDADSAEIAKQMVERLMRRRLDENVVTTAYALKLDGGQLKPISAAQLSRLRNIIHDELMGDGKCQRVLDYLNGVKDADPKKRKTGALERSATKKQFTRARIGGKRLADWIQAIAELNEADTPLAQVFQPGDAPSLGPYKAELTRELKEEYALKFLDAALRRALKVNRD